MQQNSLTKEYLIDWLIGYMNNGRIHVHEYVCRYLHEKYFDLQLYSLEIKESSELIEAIVNASYPSMKKNVRKMVENSTNKELAKMIMSMSSLNCGTSTSIDDIVNNISNNGVNNIFLEHIKTLSNEHLRDIVSLFLYHEEYFEAQADEDLESLSEDEEEKEENNNEKDSKIKEYFPVVTDKELLDAMIKYESN